MTTTPLTDLYDQHGQSPWLDNLKRGYITSGQLVAVRDSGVRGLTSNPSIFQKAIQGSADYDEQFNEIATDGGSIVDDYWSLVIRDIHGAVVVEASRVADSGGAGDVLVADSVRQLAAGKGFSFDLFGEFDLKGFDTPRPVRSASTSG